MARALSVLAVLAIGCSNSEAPAQSQGGGPPPPLVEVATVGDGDLTDGWTYLGQVQPALAAELAAAVAGHVKSLGVREGDSVKKGEVLVKLDTATIGAEVNATRAKEKATVAELEQARKQLARVQEINSGLSDPERERFELAVSTLEATLAAQKADTRRVQVAYSQHIIKAPFAGVVRARHTNPGAWISIGQPVLEVVSLEDIEIHVAVSAELGKRVSVGDIATLRGDTTVDADVVGVVPALDSDTRTIRVRLVPKERPSWLIPGMAVDVEFKVKLEGEGVTVSLDALIRGPVEVRVMKVVEGKGVPVVIEVLAITESKALIRGEGLKVGDQVVVRGNERLRPNTPLRVSE
jgi:RND family efflux transporter MFP subunit